MKLASAAWIVTIATACGSSSSSSSSSSDCDTSKAANIPIAYEKATGRKLTEDDCVRPSGTFRNLVWIGSFAYDAGCEHGSVLVGCVLNPPGFAAKAMAGAGWATADLATRTKLALAWLREIDDLQIVDTTPERFPQPFAAPSAAARGNTTVVELWTMSPSGKERIDYYHHLEVTFASDGTHPRPKTIEDVAVSR